MKRLALSVILILVLALGLVWSFRHWEAKVRRDEREKVTKELQDAWEKQLREAEAKASEQLTTLRNQHVQNLADIDRQLRSALHELRNRPSRDTIPAKPTDQPTRPAICTGAELAREDAEFLTREAAAAARQQEQLKEAVGAYNTCRKTLEEVTSGTRTQ